ncbi:MAG TPA: fused MFS/spermidine synthase [Polyangia bacterium]|nr:fused MFS/spermidine synthase [Polyangia bacterium]
MGRTTVLSLFALSGASGLIDETVWVRLLKLVFGNTTVAASVTISVFMGGLALGAWLIRSRVDGLRNKLGLYGLLELLVGLLALLTLPLLAGTDRIYVHVYRAWAPSGPMLLGLQVVLSTIVLLLPTCLMGMTLPLLSSWLVDNPALLGSRSGLLYAANTLGAVLGSFVAGFFLIELLGVANTLRVAAGSNVAVGLAALIFSPRASGLPLGTAAEEAPGPAGEVPRRVVDVWLFAGGFIALGYEIVWIRTSVSYLKATTYAFSSILSVYLLGYAAGLFAGSRLARRTRNPRRWAIATLLAIGMSGVLYVGGLVGLSNLLSGRLAGTANRLLFRFDRYFILGYCLIVFLVPSLLMGASFPLLVQLRRGASVSAGRMIASAYALNTMGSVAGPLVTGFLLIPLLGSQASIQLLGLTSCALALAALQHRDSIGWKVGPPVAFVAAAICVAATPAHAYLSWLNKVEGRNEHTEMIDAIEGITTTASVHRYVDKNFKVITTAGINVAGDQVALRQTQKAQGHIPVILHGGAKSVLTVGFGSGELTKLLTQHEVPEITCVELSPEMVQLSKRQFSHINLGEDLERRVRMIYMDAKNFIHLTDKKYDVVLNDAIWPGLFAENSSLYTREYFADGKAILNDLGIYSSWLPLSLSEKSLKSILRTFSDVFENTILVYPHFNPSQHFLLVGQKRAHPYSYAAMQREIDKGAVAESLASIGISSADDILEFIFTDDPSVKAWTADAPLNTDQFPVVEFDHDLYRSGFNVFLQWQNLYQMMQVMHPANIASLIEFSSDAERERVVAQVENRQSAVFHLLMSFMYLDPAKNQNAVEEGLRIDPTNASLLHRRDTLGSP